MSGAIGRGRELNMSWWRVPFVNLRLMLSAKIQSHWFGEHYYQIGGSYDHVTLSGKHALVSGYGPAIRYFERLAGATLEEAA